ncbi:hypothetical protein BHE74_00055479 [Ensete ventricosum]|nr:hypothetical protein GW17_00031597 [Ensete ventricosum]RWW39218.1 hypothetical protein BHE74_00055479 [Ensete ventricosum]RZS15773.1 hypothetical protein BHM03_00047653 [Ensete ventricosum]
MDMMNPSNEMSSPLCEPANLVVFTPNNATESGRLQQWREHSYVKPSSSPFSSMDGALRRTIGDEQMHGFRCHQCRLHALRSTHWSDAKPHGDGEQESDHFPVSGCDHKWSK